MAKQGTCWDGYVQKGMKKKGNKMVPNCVPAGKVMKAAMGRAAFSETTSKAPGTKMKQEIPGGRGEHHGRGQVVKATKEGPGDEAEGKPSGFQGKLRRRHGVARGRQPGRPK